MTALTFDGRARTLLLTGLAIVATSLALTAVLVRLVPYPPSQYSASQAAGIFLLAVFVSPPFEETIFRGAVISALEPLAGFWGAALLSNTVWTGLHFILPGTRSPIGLATIFTLGLIFSAMLKKTGSLWPCIIGHACFNGVRAGLILSLAMK